MGRGLRSDLAERIVSWYSDWEVLCSAESAKLAEQFTLAERDSIERAKTRREIPRATVKRLIEECEFKCAICWNVDSDSGVMIHHIRPHAAAPDDRYENLIILCVDHHDKVHTKRELTRHPYPPEYLLRRKEEFAGAITAFKAGKRVAPGREKNTHSGTLVPPPLPPSHFVGRDLLVRSVVDALNPQNGRAAIVGMGGVGKTALALKVVDGCRDKFPGGILWAEPSTDFGGIPGILRAWIRSLDHDVSGMEIAEQLALLGMLLTKRVTIHGHLLLLIDDAGERIAEDLVRLASYVPPGVSILMTTREATVSAAIGARQFPVEPLERTDCLRLLESVSGSTLVRSEASAVDSLLSLLGDLPLAVELVARQIATRERKPEFSIAGICRRLEQFDSKILSFPGHRGIALSFALSYEHLNENEQRIFRSFGIFTFGLLNTFSVAAVAATSEEETEEILDRLVMVSMLNWETNVTDYRIHPLLHKYAEFLFLHVDDLEQTSTRLRFYQHYTSTAITLAKEDSENLDAVDRILSNLNKAIYCAAASAGHSTVIETVLGLCAGMNFFMERNLEHESIQLLELAIAAAKHLGDRNGESACMGHLGSAYSRLGMIKEAIPRYERAIATAKQTGNDYDLASHLQNLGSTLLSQATDLPRAERLLHKALAAAERSMNADVVIGSLSTLGTLHRDVGNLEEAARLYDGALKAARLAGNRLAEGNNLSNLGVIIHQLGNSAEGEQMIREALAIAVEIGDIRGEGNRNGHLGGIIIAKAARLSPGSEQSSMLVDSRKLIATALRFAHETGDAEKVGVWEMNLGSICTLEGKFVEGIDQYEMALRIARSGGFARLEAQVRFNLGLALAPMGEPRAALDHFRVSSTLLRAMGSPMTARVETYISRLNDLLAKSNPSERGQEG